MKVSEAWLRTWVNPNVDGETLARTLTMAGFEVESYDSVCPEFTHVVVGFVESACPHPEADRLTLCQVNVGNNTLLSIVCGAKNVRQGIFVPVAKIGATLPNGMVIKETILRGQLSQGMICSESELGLTLESNGIWILDENAPLGESIRTYLDLDDKVFELNITPNRGDMLSIKGIARELSGLYQTKLMPFTISGVPSSHALARQIHLKAKEACPIFYGRIFTDINKYAVTPKWMAMRLQRSGIRLIHPIVDITNYVMLLFGQPLHAYDNDTLTGDITVQFAQKADSLVLLDDSTLHAKANTVWISDEASALSVAGIMGGKASSITENTSAIFLECAWFNPIQTAKMARETGMITDASMRFERGVDPTIQSMVMDYASELIVAILGAKAGPIVEANEYSNVTSKSISFPTESVKKLTGMDVPLIDMERILTDLVFHITKREAMLWDIQVPSHRFDIERHQDIVEEIIRVYGYDNLPKLPLSGLFKKADMSKSLCYQDTLASILVARGYHEAIHYAFVCPSFQSHLFPLNEALTLINPISSELSQMRLSLLPGLLSSVSYNENRSQYHIQLFEQGTIFTIEKGTLIERSAIAGVLYGLSSGLTVHEKARDVDFYDIKGDVCQLLRTLGIDDATFVVNHLPTMWHPGKSASIMQGEKVLGYVGAIHPLLLSILDCTKDIYAFELYLDTIESIPSKKYQSTSKFPMIRRDLSFIMEDTIEVGNVLQLVKRVISPLLLKEVAVYDIFKGESIPVGMKSVAIAMYLQHPEKTLIDADITEMMSHIIQALIASFSIQLRDE
jgi:phenylalanyl-tRNA synthetase beta chain